MKNVKHIIVKDFFLKILRSGRFGYQLNFVSRSIVRISLIFHKHFTKKISLSTSFSAINYASFC